MTALVACAQAAIDVEVTRYVLHNTIMRALDRMLGNPNHELWWWLVDALNRDLVYSRVPIVRVKVGLQLSSTVNTHAMPCSNSYSNARTARPVKRRVVHLLLWSPSAQPVMKAQTCSACMANVTGMSSMVYVSVFSRVHRQHNLARAQCWTSCKAMQHRSRTSTVCTMRHPRAKA